MAEQLPPFAAVVGGVRVLTIVDAASVFPDLRRIRQAKQLRGGPLYYLHASSRDCVRTLIERPPPEGLDARLVPSLVASLFAHPPLAAESGDVHTRVGTFFDTMSAKAFVASLTAQVLAPDTGPAAFAEASLNAEPIDVDDPVGLELACLFVENALAGAELPPGTAVDVWAWRGASEEDRRRVQVLSRLAGRESVFRGDLAVGRGGIATLPAHAARVIVVPGSDDASTQRWRASAASILDAAPDDCLDAARAELCASTTGRFREAISRVQAEAEAAALRPSAPAAPAPAARAAGWQWGSHARARAEERDVPVALVDEHVVEPARDTPPRQINRDPTAAAEGRTVIVGECPATAEMPDGCRLYRGVIPGPTGDRVVVLAVGWKPQADGGRKIHTLYYPSDHPTSWNTDCTRATPAGEAAGDFPRGTRWFLPQ